MSYQGKRIQYSKTFHVLKTIIPIKDLYKSLIPIRVGGQIMPTHPRLISTNIFYIPAPLHIPKEKMSIV